MYYTGIDLHRKTSFVTTINEHGQIVRKGNIINNESDILDYFLNLDADTKVVIESTSSWYWLYDLLVEHGLPVMISNPVKTKAIASAKIKNDKLDSYMLAQLLRSNMIAGVHASSARCRQLKELLRHRAKLVRDCVRHKNRIQNIMAKNNLAVPSSDLFGKRGLAFLSQVTLPDYHRRAEDTYLQLYLALKAEVDQLTRQTTQEAKADPMARLLMTIPGVGPITALFLIADIGDIRRFKSYRHLAAYQTE